MEEIGSKLKAIVKKLFGVEMEPEVVLATGKKMSDGRGVDFASNVAMRLTRELKKNPLEIAEAIKREFESENTDVIVEVAKPGFLNFMLLDEYWKARLGEFGADFEKNISCSEYSGQTVVCEFSDPNPFKVLHVGHLYTSIVGDAISRLIEFAGGKVMRANFGGDVGLHVAKTIYEMNRRKDELFGENLEKWNALTVTEKSEKMAECYVAGTQAYEDDEQARAEIVDLNKKIYQITANNERDSEIAQIYWLGRETSYAYFEEFYVRVGVKFDKYYPESMVAGKGLAVVKEQLKNGVYEESDGAVVFKGEKYGLHTRVFINKEGLPTYEAKDVGLIFTKWEDYQFDKSVIITGNDIVDYMKVVLASISEYEPKLAERTMHLTHGNVRLPGNEKMSSRKGNFLKAVDVLGMIEDALSKQHNNLDTKVAMGATKYAFLKYKIGGNIEFSVDDSVSMTGNSGPYLQYAAVRAKKILGGMLKDGVSESEGAWELNEFEKELIKKVVQYREIVATAVHEAAPHKVCEYLYELAQTFSRFYENVKVVGSEYEKERGEIVLAYLKTLTHGLNILGIEVPEKM